MEHTYSLVLMMGNKTKVNKTFASRNAANAEMYHLCGKYGLHINKIYDDKHDKTYLCDADSTFYIIRLQ